jgi:hypothetical protein
MKLNRPLLSSAVSNQKQSEATAFESSAPPPKSRQNISSVILVDVVADASTVSTRSRKHTESLTAVGDGSLVDGVDSRRALASTSARGTETPLGGAPVFDVHHASLADKKFA